MFRATIDVLNPKPDSIYCVLKRKLGREPKHSELTAEVGRILQEARSCPHFLGPRDVPYLR